MKWLRCLGHVPTCVRIDPTVTHAALLNSYKSISLMNSATFDPVCHDWNPNNPHAAVLSSRLHENCTFVMEAIMRDGRAMGLLMLRAPNCFRKLHPTTIMQLSRIASVGSCYLAAARLRLTFAVGTNLSNWSQVQDYSVPFLTDELIHCISGYVNVRLVRRSAIRGKMLGILSVMSTHCSSKKRKHVEHTNRYASRMAKICRA